MKRTLILILLLLARTGFSQDWEKMEESFLHYFQEKEYAKAGELAASQANFCIEHLDSTDIRYIRSFYNLGHVYFELQMWDEAQMNLGIAYRLVVPLYARYGTDIGNISELYGRAETQLGHFESAESFLSYARDVRIAVNGKESNEYVQSLYYLADLYVARSDGEKALGILSEALQVQESHHRWDQAFAKYGNTGGLEYLDRGEYEEAVRFFQRALKSYAEGGVEVDFNYAHLQNNLGLTLYYMSDFENAALHFEKAGSAYRELLKEYSENYMMLLNNLASLYYSWQKPDLARKAYLRLEAYADANPRENGPKYIQALENAANYHAELGELKPAEKFYKKAIEVRRNTDPADQRELAGSILLLATLYYEHGSGELGAETAMEALDILQEVCEPGDTDLATAQYVIGRSYQEAELTNRALYHYQQSREQLEWNGDSVTADFSSLYNNMGVLYLGQSRLGEAIINLEKADRLTPGDPNVQYNLGYAYASMGNMQAANSRFEEATAIFKEQYGAGNVNYAQAIITGVVTRSQNEKHVDESFLEEISEAEQILLENGVQKTDQRYLDCLDAYITIYYRLKEYQKAYEYGDLKRTLTKKKYGRKSYPYVESLLRLADSYLYLEEREDLDKLYREALSIATSLDESVKDDAMYLVHNSMEAAYYYLGDYDLASSSAEKIVETEKRWYLENEAYMTLQELSDFSSTMTDHLGYYNYLVQLPDHPEIVSNALNNRLFFKNLLLDSEKRQRRALSETTDARLLELQNEHAVIKETVSNLRSQFGVEQHVLDSLDQRLTEVEREISRRVSGEIGQARRYFHWQEIRDKLKEGEAAVEIVNFYHRTPPPTIYLEPLYYAFVITPDMKDHPLCIRLFEAVDVYPYYLAYRNSVESPADSELGDSIYNKLWAPLDSLLSGTTRVYFSPDVIYHEMNIESLKDQAGRYILDKYEIVYLNSLTELLDGPRQFGENHLALLAGDPKFSIVRNRIPETADEGAGEEIPEIQSRMFHGARLSPLPGTRTEVENIGILMQEHGWYTAILTGEDASEEKVTYVRNPRVLHLATHGFFAMDQKPKSDTVFQGMATRSYDYQDPENQNRSCLFLAGAQNTLFYAYDYEKGKRDGILTAWEISEMELDSTELVVLSACETGLGDILLSEGITGLRRAFQLAGASRIMLSLWEVDDQATQLLMRQFYSNWLSGISMHLALAQAKKYLRDHTEYSHPRYWAGFILTGI